MRTRRRKSKRSNDESHANGKNGNRFLPNKLRQRRSQPITSEWLTPELDGLIYDQFGSALGRLSGVEHVSSDLDLDPFIGSHEIEELKNFSAKAVSENEVRVKFELFGEKRDITLRLICDKDCLIDDVKLSDGGSLKAKIKKSLKAAYPSNYGKIFKE